jgi:hypothetical protein
VAALEPVVFQEIPASVEAFLSLRDQVAVVPQGGAAMMVMALLAYAESEDLGRQCLTAAVDRDRLVEGPEGVRGWQLSKRDLRRIQTQLAGQPYLPRSYFEKATPENGYQLAEPPHVLSFSDSPYSGDPASGTYKVFVQCSGAPSARPVTVKRNNRGIWKADSWSSLITGVRAPVQAADDDL